MSDEEKENQRKKKRKRSGSNEGQLSSSNKAQMLSSSSTSNNSNSFVGPTVFIGDPSKYKKQERPDPSSFLPTSSANFSSSSSAVTSAGTSAVGSDKPGTSKPDTSKPDTSTVGSAKSKAIVTSKKNEKRVKSKKNQKTLLEIILSPLDSNPAIPSVASISFERSSGKVQTTNTETKIITNMKSLLRNSLLYPLNLGNATTSFTKDASVTLDDKKKLLVTLKNFLEPYVTCLNSMWLNLQEVKRTEQEKKEKKEKKKGKKSDKDQMEQADQAAQMEQMEQDDKDKDEDKDKDKDKSSKASDTAISRYRSKVGSLCTSLNSSIWTCAMDILHKSNINNISESRNEVEGSDLSEAIKIGGSKVTKETKETKEIKENKGIKESKATFLEGKTVVDLLQSVVNEYAKEKPQTPQSTKFPPNPEIARDIKEMELTLKKLNKNLKSYESDDEDERETMEEIEELKAEKEELKNFLKQARKAQTYWQKHGELEPSDEEGEGDETPDKATKNKLDAESGVADEDVDNGDVDNADVVDNDIEDANNNNNNDNDDDDTDYDDVLDYASDSDVTKPMESNPYRPLQPKDYDIEKEFDTETAEYVNKMKEFDQFKTIQQLEEAAEPLEDRKREIISNLKQFKEQPVTYQKIKKILKSMTSSERKELINGTPELQQQFSQEKELTPNELHMLINLPRLKREFEELNHKLTDILNQIDEVIESELDSRGESKKALKEKGQVIYKSMRENPKMKKAEDKLKAIQQKKTEDEKKGIVDQDDEKELSGQKEISVSHESHELEQPEQTTQTKEKTQAEQAKQAEHQKSLQLHPQQPQTPPLVLLVAKKKKKQEKSQPQGVQENQPNQKQTTSSLPLTTTSESSTSSSVSSSSSSSLSSTSSSSTSSTLLPSLPFSASSVASSSSSLSSLVLPKPLLATQDTQPMTVQPTTADTIKKISEDLEKEVKDIQFLFNNINESNLQNSISTVKEKMAIFQSLQEQKRQLVKRSYEQDIRTHHASHFSSPRESKNIINRTTTKCNLLISTITTTTNELLEVLNRTLHSQYSTKSKSATSSSEHGTLSSMISSLSSPLSTLLTQLMKLYQQLSAFDRVIILHTILIEIYTPVTHLGDPRLSQIVAHENQKFALDFEQRYNKTYIWNILSTSKPTITSSSSSQKAITAVRLLYGIFVKMKINNSLFGVGSSSEDLPSEGLSVTELYSSHSYLFPTEKKYVNMMLLSLIYFCAHNVSIVPFLELIYEECVKQKIQKKDLSKKYSLGIFVFGTLWFILQNPFKNYNSYHQHVLKSRKNANLNPSTSSISMSSSELTLYKKEETNQVRKEIVATFTKDVLDFYMSAGGLIYPSFFDLQNHQIPVNNYFTAMLSPLSSNKAGKKKQKHKQSQPLQPLLQSSRNWVVLLEFSNIVIKNLFDWF